MNERIDIARDIQFKLTNADKLSPLWARLKVYLEMELQSARIRNDNANLSDYETAALRGRISTLKRFIALGDEDRPQTE